MIARAADRPTRGEGTRARILDAALALFAERGYRGATVADIEDAAGLAPRSGALYQHFKGKEEVLRAAVGRQVEELGLMQDAMEMLPLGDLRAELLLIGRWNLADLARRQLLYRFLWKEGDQFPDLRDRLGEAFVERPLRRVAEWLRAHAERAGVPEPDCEALTLVIVQSMAAYRSLESLYGHPPLDVDEERFLDAWVETCLALIARAGIDVVPSKTPA
jgi:AcrR family transcriptional regulator